MTFRLFSLFLTFFLAGFLSCNPKTKVSDCMTDPIEDMACTMQYDPVCGCDGKTYGNECMARIAGVKKFTEGECL